MNENSTPGLTLPETDPPAFPDNTGISAYLLSR